MRRALVVAALLVACAPTQDPDQLIAEFREFRKTHTCIPVGVNYDRIAWSCDDHSTWIVRPERD